MSKHYLEHDTNGKLITEGASSRMVFMILEIACLGREMGAKETITIPQPTTACLKKKD
jgi:hypothetical protein